MVNILQSITSDNFSEYQYSIDRCINSADSMNYILSTYRLIKENPDQGMNLLVGQLSGITTNIENEIAYKLFCELIGAKYSDKNGEESESIPFFLLVQSLKKETYPFYPWQDIDDNNFLVYEEDIEKSYYQELDTSKNKQVQNFSCYSFQYEFDKKLISVINEMKKCPRSKEILNLYKTFLLVEDLQKNDDLKNTFNKYNVVDFKSPFLDKGGLPINQELYEIRKNEYQNKPKELFLKHFLETMKNLQSKGKINMKIEMDDVKWIVLQEKLVQFGGKLLEMLRTHKFTLRDIELFVESQKQKENVSFKLFNDFWNLIAKNQVESPIGLDDFPTAREISRIRPGGPGILKRINKYGGLTEFKKKFIRYIMGSMHMKKAVELANDKSSKLTAQIDINKLIATKEKSQESK